MKEKSTTPWIRVFTDPRGVAKEYAAERSNYGLGWISGIYGFLVLLECLQNLSAGTHYALWVVILFSLFFAIPAGYITLSIAAGLIWWTGKLLNGKASFTAIRSALAWSKIPEVVGLLGWVLLMMVYKANVFVPAFIQKTYNFSYFTLPTGVMIFQIIFSLWGFIILLLLLSEVQGFSAWLALINVILKSIVLAILAAAMLWFFTSATYVGPAVSNIMIKRGIC